MQHQTTARRAIRWIRPLVVVFIVTGVGWPAQAQAVGGGPATTAVVASGRSGPAVAARAGEAAALDVAWLVLLGVPLLAAGLLLLVKPALNRDRAVRRFRAELRRPDAMDLLLSLEAQEATRAQARRHHPARGVSG